MHVIVGMVRESGREDKPTSRPLILGSPGQENGGSCRFFLEGAQSPVQSAVGVCESMGSQGAGVTFSALGQHEARSSLGGSSLL